MIWTIRAPHAKHTAAEIVSVGITRFMHRFENRSSAAALHFVSPGRPTRFGWQFSGGNCRNNSLQKNGFDARGDSKPRRSISPFVCPLGMKVR